jgi:hypothetical protein
MRRQFPFLLVPALLLVACGSSPTDPGSPEDGGSDAADSVTETATDSSTDSSLDSGADSTPDSSLDSGTDTGKKDSGKDTGPPSSCPPLEPTTGDPCSFSGMCTYGDPTCPDYCYCKGSTFYCSPCSPPPPPPPPWDAGICPPVEPAVGDPCSGATGPCSYPDSSGCTTTCYCKSSWDCFPDPCGEIGPGPDIGPPPPPPDGGSTCAPCATPGDPCSPTGMGCGTSGPGGCCWSCSCTTKGWDCTKC